MWECLEGSIRLADATLHNTNKLAHKVARAVLRYLEAAEKDVAFHCDEGNQVRSYEEALLYWDHEVGYRRIYLQKVLDEYEKAMKEGS